MKKPSNARNASKSSASASRLSIYYKMNLSVYKENMGAKELVKKGVVCLTNTLPLTNLGLLNPGLSLIWVMLVPAACTLTLCALCQFSWVTPDKLGVGRSFLAICDPWDPYLPFLIRLQPFFSTNLCALRVPACSAKNALISSIELPL